MVDLEDLKAKALAATTCDLSTAELVRPSGGYIECPVCGGDGHVHAGNDFVNFDDLPIGVQFYGFGDEINVNEVYFRSFTPATAIALIDILQATEQERDAIKANYTALESLCKTMGETMHALTLEKDALKAELKAERDVRRARRESNLRPTA